MSVAVLSQAGTAPATASNLADLDEPVVIERAVAGDLEAFGELFRRYEVKVRRTLQFQLRAYPSDVDDVVSEVFLRAMSLIGTYERRDRPFSSWLNQIIHWRAVAHRSWRLHRYEDQLDAADSSDACVMAQEALNPEREVLLRLELLRLLRSLPARRRLALVLRDWAGCSYDEIARALNLSHRAADALITNARKAAREAARSEQALADRTTCECGCGRPVADSANGAQRFATPDCWRQVEYERRWGRRPKRREAA